MASVAALKARVPSRYKQAARRAFLRASALTSTGSRLACPTCGHRFRKFARFHGEHDQCPRCGSLMRHRALTLLLRDRLRFPERDVRVLHVGPGESVGRWIASHDRIEYLSVDLASPVAMMRADVTDLPLEDESFDVVLCIHVLEHVPDDRAALAEMHRVLRPGGEAVFQVPPSRLEQTFEDESVTEPADRERVFGQFDHVRICGADYGERIEGPGFEVESVDYAAGVEPADRLMYGLRAGEPFFLCKKPARAE
jgi:SAM-dependent methyltransferase